MKLMCSEIRFMRLSLVVLLSFCVLTVGIAAQSKKAAAKKPVAKKNEKQAMDARKDSKSKVTAKKDTKKNSNDKASAKKKEADKRDKSTAKSNSRDKDSKKKLDPKKAAEQKRAEAARRRAEEERRQAAIAEQRRREQAAREARERRLAFERGLRTETVQNIESDNTDGEDMTVRRAAVNALGSRAGTVVVMEAKTGKLLTVVNQDWAIKHGFKPCSTIKLVTGVAGINEQVIEEGSSSLDYALAKSSNGYFQRVGSRFGNSKMIDYAKKLGLGEPTGVNAEGETAGKLPYGNNNARIYSHGDDFEVTPLQLAVMVSAISNGGKKVVPQFQRPRVERTNYRAKSASNVDVPRTSVEGVLSGMAGAAEYGTARRGVDASMGVAGKTGSCIGKGSWVGLFASVAPIEDPKYAVVVITRGQSERGKYAASVAGQIYNALRPRINRNPDSIWAKRTMKPASPPADSQLARGEDEDEDEMDDAERQTTPIVVGRPVVTAPTQPAFKKVIQKTAQSKPVFAPVVIEYDRSGAEKKRPRIVKN